MLNVLILGMFFKWFPNYNIFYLRNHRSYNYRCMAAQSAASSSPVLFAKLGTKGTLHTLPTLHNNEPVPQVLKQVVNLSCLHWNKHYSSHQNSYIKFLWVFWTKKTLSHCQETCPTVKKPVKNRFCFWNGSHAISLWWPFALLC